MLSGKVAIVTGGTRGIGRAIVEKFLENNAKVILFGSREESANKAVEEIKKEHPNWEVSCLWPNLSNYDEVSEAFNYVAKKYGKLDILVNNAGISQRTKLYDYKIEDFDKILDLNIKAILVGSKAAAEIMRAA